MYVCIYIFTIFDIHVRVFKTQASQSFRIYFITPAHSGQLAQLSTPTARTRM